MGKSSLPLVTLMLTKRVACSMLNTVDVRGKIDWIFNTGLSCCNYDCFDHRAPTSERSDRLCPSVHSFGPCL